jgi:hypothetical protein
LTANSVEVGQRVVAESSVEAEQRAREARQQAVLRLDRE